MHLYILLSVTEKKAVFVNEEMTAHCGWENVTKRVPMNLFNTQRKMLRGKIGRESMQDK